MYSRIHPSSPRQRCLPHQTASHIKRTRPDQSGKSGSTQERTEERTRLLFINEPPATPFTVPATGLWPVTFRPLVVSPMRSTAARWSKSIGCGSAEKRRARYGSARTGISHAQYVYAALETASHAEQAEDSRLHFAHAFCASHAGRFTVLVPHCCGVLWSS